MYMDNLMTKIQNQIDQEMKANRVYKQAIQIQKMEQKQGRKRELYEEKKKQWEVELEKLRAKLEEKYYKQFPHLMEKDIISEPEPEVLPNGM